MKISHNGELIISDEAPRATSKNVCKIYNLAAYSEPSVAAPKNHTEISELVSKWEKDARRRAALEKARAWHADTFYPDSKNTVRSLRLRKGWSQTQLAEELSTSQSHIARIEKGTENLTIETCRKLANALGIDLNTLDQALRRQELVAQRKVRAK